MLVSKSESKILEQQKSKIRKFVSKRKASVFSGSAAALTVQVKLKTESNPFIKYQSIIQSFYFKECL